MKKFLIIGVLLIIAMGLFAAEDKTLDETLQNFPGDILKEYTRPFVDGFGTNLNSGWFNSAPEDKIFGVNFQLSLVMMGTGFDDADKSFSENVTFNLTDAMIDNLTGAGTLTTAQKTALKQQGVTAKASGPTIIGSKDESVVIQIDQLVFPDGTIIPLTSSYKDTLEGVTGLFDDVSVLPLVAPQLTLGTVYGTQVSLRYVPKFEITDVGDFSYFGFGVQHNPKMFLSVMEVVPVDFALSYYGQKMEIGDFVEASTWAFGVNASKQFGLRFFNITPYAGLMAEGSEVNFAYDYVLNETTKEKLSVDVDIEGENTFRFTLGSSVRLGVFNIGADYNFASIPSFAARFGLAF